MQLTKRNESYFLAKEMLAGGCGSIKTHLCPGFHCVPGRDTLILVPVQGQDIHLSTKEPSSPPSFTKDVPMKAIQPV